MKKDVICFVFICMLVLSVNLVFAGFEKGDELEDIKTEYGPEAFLSGWVNISLEDENTDSLLTGFDDEIKIIDFLKKLIVSYKCSPDDCESDYSASNAETSKSFSPDFGEEKIVGLKISGAVIEQNSDISGFSMKIISNADEFCINPLKIDIFDDGEIDWRASDSSDSFCGSNNYGCYKDEGGKTKIIQTDYCEKIKLPEFPGVRIGADIVGTEDADFIMSIEDEEGYEKKECEISASGSGEVGCEIDLQTKEEKNYFVCIKAKDSNDENKYEIGLEDTAPCGFSGEYAHDFAIFARIKKYKELGEIILDEGNIESLNMNIFNYLDRYNHNCSNDCIVPIRIISGISQTISVSDINLNYKVEGIPRTINEIYDLEEEPAKIDMGFQKLDLEKAELRVPKSYGFKNLYLKLDGGEIAEKKITILEMPIIEAVVPKEIPAGVPTKIKVILKNSSGLDYKWEFGDGSEEETEIDFVKHTYDKIGSYNLEITIENALGESSKSFSIKVVSPRDYIKSRLVKDEKNLNLTKKQVENFPDWLGKIIEKQIDFDSLSQELENLEKKYEKASTNDEYINIAKSLVELKIPSKINIRSSGGTKFFIDKENIDIGHLEGAGAGDYDEDYPENNYNNAILAWSMNFDIDLEGKIYSAYYDEEISPILSYFKIKSQKELENIYFIIEGGFDRVGFDKDYGQKSIDGGGAVAIVFSKLKEIEFVLPDEISIFEAPVYFSPEFSKLELGVGNISACDFDGKCEGEENYKNCRNDCKPWGRSILYIFVLLFVGFWIYIGLQEWYKRYYEKNLFKNKNELFNLINFMNNAINHGVDRKEIFKKLRVEGWSWEKIRYAYRKFRGKRTGMWEIPLFKWVEKREVEEELEKRRKI